MVAGPTGGEGVLTLPHGQATVLTPISGVVPEHTDGRKREREREGEGEGGTDHDNYTVHVSYIV